MTDGSIKIDTKIDSSGLVEGLKRMFTKFDGSMRDLVVSSKTGIERVKEVFKNTFQKIGSTVKNAFGGMKNAGSKINGVLEMLGNVGSMAFRRIIQFIQTCIKLFGTLIGIIVALAAVLVVGVIFAIRKLLDWAQKMTDTLYKNLSVTSAMRDRVVQLKGAFDTLKGSIMAMGATLLNALAPVLMRIIDWLVKAVNWVSLFIAALSGQQTVMQYVSGAADQAAEATDNLAENTENVEKAAKGALAAFDELNVLQQDTADLADQEPETPAAAGGAGGNVMMEEVPVERPAWMEKMLEWWGLLKQKIGEIWNWIWTNVLEPLWNWLSQEIAPRVITILVETFGLLIDIAKELWKIVSPILIPALTWLWEKVLKPIAQWTGGAIINILDWIIGLLRTMREGLAERGLMGMFQNLFKYVADTAKRLWEDIKRIWNIVAGWFKEKVIDPVVNWFKTGLENIKRFFSDAWEKAKTIWQFASLWFDRYVVMPIRNAFETALNWIKTKWETTFIGIKSFVKNIINGLIDLINGMLRGIATGINGIIGAFNSISVQIPNWGIFGDAAGTTFGLNIPEVTAPQIPRLATGAVIPPNAEFAAILGDQRSGRNLEAPEGLIRQIIQEEIGNIQVETTLNFGGSLGQLVRELKPYIDRENVRIGGSLVKRSFS